MKKRNTELSTYTYCILHSSQNIGVAEIWKGTNWSAEMRYMNKYMVGVASRICITTYNWDMY